MLTLFFLYKIAMWESEKASIKISSPNKIKKRKMPQVADNNLLWNYLNSIEYSLDIFTK